MRCIDADAFAQFLKDTIKKQEYENLKIDGCLTVAEVIYAVISELDGTSFDGYKNAPTIEPERKTGQWIRWYETKEDETGTEYIPHCRCSECGTEYDPHSSKFVSFCNVCGAKMEEGGQDG